LEVYGPAGTRGMTDSILQAYAEDIKVRTEGLQGSNPATLTPNIHEIVPGIVYKDANVTVTAFPVKHGTFPNSFGYKFATPDKTIVISGDTAPTETVIEEARNADILIHEVYSVAKFAKAPPEIQAYLQAFHTSTKELAEIASKAQPKLLVPIHMLGYKDLPQGTIEEEIRKAGYQGKIASSHDLAIY
jgi:ribonuclease BN (tRNA processing enzyme)